MILTSRKKDKQSMQKIHEMRTIRAKKNNAKRDLKGDYYHGHCNKYNKQT